MPLSTEKHPCMSDRPAKLYKYQGVSDSHAIENLKKRQIYFQSPQKIEGR